MKHDYKVGDIVILNKAACEWMAIVTIGDTTKWTHDKRMVVKEVTNDGCTVCTEDKGLYYFYLFKYLYISRITKINRLLEEL